MAKSDSKFAVRPLHDKAGQRALFFDKVAQAGDRYGRMFRHGSSPTQIIGKPGSASTSIPDERARSIRSQRAPSAGHAGPRCVPRRSHHLLHWSDTAFAANNLSAFPGQPIGRANVVWLTARRDDRPLAVRRLAERFQQRMRNIVARGPA